MTLELGIYTFGNTPRQADGRPGPTAQAIRDALEAIKLADEVGLDFFGLGEHHMRAMPLSSPTSLINAAAATTQQITLGTAVTVLSTDDPVRVFQQLATAAALAPGRIEVVAGRGSSTITFPLFDYDERDYDMLFASKLQMLMARARVATGRVAVGPRSHGPGQPPVKKRRRSRSRRPDRRRCGPPTSGPLAVTASRLPSCRERTPPERLQVAHLLRASDGPAAERKLRGPRMRP